MKMFRKQTIAISLLTLLSGMDSYGYLLCSYESLKKTSELILIAVPIANHDTTNRGFIPASPHDVPVITVETRFAVLTVLKGELEDKELVLSHYKYADPEYRPVRVGPRPLAFDVTKRNRYLMFLKRDGSRIVPARGLDTAWSIKMLTDESTP